MRATVHHSEDIDSADAIAEVLADAASQWGDSVPQAGFLIAAIDHELDVMQRAVMERWPGLELIGCSANSQITSVLGTAEDSTALMLLASDRIRFKAGLGTQADSDPVGATRRAVAQATEGSDERPSLCIVLVEGQGLDSDLVLRTFQAELGEDILLAGGLASEPTHVNLTRQLFKGEVHHGAVVCMMFFGPLSVSTAVKSGMRPVGTRHKVTKVSGPWIQEIDGRPAEDLWIQYVGVHSAWSPLAVFPSEDGQFYLTTSPKVDEHGAAFVFAPVPVGAGVQFADVTQDEIIAAAGEACDIAVAGYPGRRPTAGLVISCSGRRGMLGTRVGEEIDQLLSRLDERIPLIGFYSNGEVCPLPGQQTARNHNYTFVTVLFGEE